MTNQTYGIILVTTASEQEAESLAQTLVETKLAACVNFFPIQSVYVWQGEVCHEPEWQLVIKTNLQHFSVIEAKIRSLHSYEVPEIVALSITNGSQPYLNWISEQIQ
jgi:periplasmic divalent cation tolerance protein